MINNRQCFSLPDVLFSEQKQPEGDMVGKSLCKTAEVVLGPMMVSHGTPAARACADPLCKLLMESFWGGFRFFHVHGFPSFCVVTGNLPSVTKWRKAPINLARSLIGRHHRIRGEGFRWLESHSKACSVST